MKKRVLLVVVTSTLFTVAVAAQAPKEYLDQSPPSPKTKVVTIQYVNSFDGSANEALLEVPAPSDRGAPLIVTPNAAGWTQEMNRSLWSGVADQFGVFILYPRHQGSLIPNITLGTPKQIANLESAIAAVEKKYKVDESRVYAAGLSQGAIETLLLVGSHPLQFAGALSINGIPDYLAFYGDLKAFLDHPPAAGDDPLTKIRLAQWPGFVKLLELDTGGTPETSRAEYYRRSSVIYAEQLARIPLILYWAEDDELIPNGAYHQGGMLANLIRTFQPANFKEVKHTGGHGYPFFQFDLARMSVKMFPRQVFLDSVKQLLDFKNGTVGPNN